MMNPNWSRWAFASVSKWFDSKITPTLPLYVEGEDRRTSDLSDFAEFRMDGPYTNSFGDGLYRLRFEINVLVSSAKNDKDIHQIHRSVGVVCAAFTLNIPLFRYGDGVDDDSTIFGCLQQISGEREALIVSHFGQVDMTVQLLQATIEGHYYVLLQNN